MEVMTRQLTVEAEPLDENHILGLRQSFASAQVGDIHLTWDSGFGFGAISLSVTAKFPDGRQVSETMKLGDMIREWGMAVINEHQKPDPSYTLCAVEDCPFFVEPNTDYDGPDGILSWYIHLHRGDEADEARDDHDAMPGEVHPLSWWKEHGPDRVKERFVE